MSEQTIAVYPGTFDPITNGHLDILERSLAVFDRLIVAIATNPRKQPLFTVDERIELRTSNVQIVLDGSDIIVEAAAGIRFSADKNLILQGNNIHLNCDSVADEDAKADGEARDDAEKPEGRVAASIAQLLRKGGE